MLGIRKPWLAAPLLAAFCAFGLRAQQAAPVVPAAPAAPVAPAVPAAPAAGQTALDQQKSSLAAMEESIGKQRQSVQQQAGPAAPGGFFLLPPPAGLGALLKSMPSAPAADCDPLPDSEIDSLIKTAAARESIGEDVLRGVIKQESAFRPCAVSSKGAQGLMQLMPATAGQFGLKDPFDPSQNVGAGAKLLKQLLVRYGGDLAKALGAYNAGPARVDAANGVPAISETQDYVNRIVSSLPVVH